MLAAEKRGRSGAEPSGAPETLAGRLTKMGDRVSFAKPERPGADAGVTPSPAQPPPSGRPPAGVCRGGQ